MGRTATTSREPSTADGVGRPDQPASVTAAKAGHLGELIPKQSILLLITGSPGSGSPNDQRVPEAEEVVAAATASGDHRIEGKTGETGKGSRASDDCRAMMTMMTMIMSVPSDLTAIAPSLDYRTLYPSGPDSDLAPDGARDHPDDETQRPGRSLPVHSPPSVNKADRAANQMSQPEMVLAATTTTMAQSQIEEEEERQKQNCTDNRTKTKTEKGSDESDRTRTLQSGTLGQLTDPETDRKRPEEKCAAEGSKLDDPESFQSGRQTDNNSSNQGREKKGVEKVPTRASDQLSMGGGGDGHGGPEGAGQPASQPNIAGSAPLPATGQLPTAPAVASGRHGTGAIRLPPPNAEASKNPVKAAFRLVQQSWGRTVAVNACDARDRPHHFRFRYLDVIGNGTFGIVCKARNVDTDELVAIKTVFQDECHQNRELYIIKSLQHGNIVGLKYYFYTRNEYNEEFLSLVLEYMPVSLDRLLKEGGDGHAAGRGLSGDLIRAVMRQFLQALDYLHGRGVCHRDIKPHNVLVDPTACLAGQAGGAKLCDFGCSKRLVPGEPNIQYICARYYRAPEIAFGWPHYSLAIDMWSVGCVMAELYSGRPLFPGKNSVDQLARIVRILGTPSPAELTAMGQDPKRFRTGPPLSGEQRKTALWGAVGQTAMPEAAIDLLVGLLQYDPKQRTTPAQALSSPYFGMHDEKE